MIRSKMYAVLNKLPASCAVIPLMLFYYIRDGKKVVSNYRLLARYKKEHSRNRAMTKEEKLLYKMLHQYCLYMSRGGAKEYITSYLGDADFRCLKQNIKDDVPEDVILLCCVKNDLKKVQNIYNEHKKIGIKNYVFVDNMSTDGTIEWLLQQEVDVYQTNDKYHAGAKAAWCRKIWDIYGYDRWYLILDSDELFTYPGMEEHPIGELISYAQNHNIERVRSISLDMYSDRPLFSSGEEDDILRDYRFFDTNSYYKEEDCRGVMVRGGPRLRLFEERSEYGCRLTKFPLIFVRFEDLWADHLPLPYKKNYVSPCLSVLRHYKFLVGDEEKYRKIIADGNYTNGSYEYKQYMQKFEQNRDLSFYNKDSAEYVDSSSLLKISFIKKVL